MSSSMEDWTNVGGAIDMKVYSTQSREEYSRPMEEAPINLATDQVKLVFQFCLSFSGVSSNTSQLMYFPGKNRQIEGLVSKTVNYRHNILKVGLQNYKFS